MRQRVMIAMAIACNPALLIADEPTTALDVTIQAQILELIQGLREERKMSILFITHDLGIIAENAARVGIMYAGRIMELAETREIFSNPRHPYTMACSALCQRKRVKNLCLSPALSQDLKPSRLAASFQTGAAMLLMNAGRKSRGLQKSFRGTMPAASGRTRCHGTLSIQGLTKHFCGTQGLWRPETGSEGRRRGQFFDSR